MSPTMQTHKCGKRRRQHALAQSSTTLLSLLFLVFALMSLTSAYEVEFDAQVYESEHFKKLARQGQIHIDRRDPPLVQLQARQQTTQSAESSIASSPSSSQSASTSISVSASSSTKSPSATNTTVSSSNSSSTTSSTTTASPSVAVVTTTLPSPFDTSLGNNFTTSSCPAFFTSFLSNSTFRSCLPASLLLQNSNSFFRAERSPSLLASTLDATCAASLAICTPLLTNMALDLISDSHCGADYRAQNPIVMQAYNGFLAYEPIYRATCLKNSATGAYCFADAIANSSNSADGYPYFTALGLNLPATAQPSCTSCLKQTMQIFAQYALRKEQPLVATYLNCADQVNHGCGAGFADASVKVGSVNDGTVPTSGAAAAAETRGGSASVSVLVAMGVLMLLHSS